MEEIKEISVRLSFKIPLDGFMTSLLERPVIDIVKFDEKLGSRYPDFKNISMENFIKKKFGTELWNRINKCF